MPRYRNAGRSGLVLAIVLVIVAAFATGAAASSPEERRLQSVRAKVAVVQAELRAASSQAEADAAALAEADRRLAVVLEAVAEAEQAVQRQEMAVVQARQRLGELRAEVEDQRRVMAGRAVSLYKRGATASVGSVLAADSAAEAVDRSSFVDVVTRSDRRAFEEVGIARTAVQAQEAQLQSEERVLARVLEDQRELLAQVREVRSDRAVAAAASRRRVDELQAEETHLEAESQRLAGLTRRVAQSSGASRTARRASAAGSASPSASAGGWVMPANGPVTSGFGRRWGRMHQGIDIGAPSGAPVYAAGAGVVSYAGTMSGYGNMVLINHGRGVVTAYAHQSRINVGVGQRVRAGQVIGAVGSTGNSTGPHLHFEVRVNGVARNPRSYV